MRFERRWAKVVEPVLDRRRLERADGEIGVLAPASWPNAQLEAWIDWGEAQGGGDAHSPLALAGAATRYMDALVQQGLADDVFDTPDDAAAFEAEIMAGLLGGLAAPFTPPRADGRETLDLSMPDGLARLDRWLGARRRRGRRRAGGGAAAG